MELLTYLPEVFSGVNLVILILGTVVGLLLGAMPGVSPTMAVALLIPFTFQMDATSGLILLGVIYASTVAGGAVSAILVNIPGAPANIATILDGHPMAKSGRATEALHYCFISSGIGGVLGVLVLIFFTPPLAELALRFGPSELFWVAILGVTVIGSLGSASVLKGLIAGAFGIWISLIGFNPILGTERFVFTSHLQGGVSIVPALIGLFAIPQVLYMVESAWRGQSGEEFRMESRSIWRSVRYNLSRVRTLSLGSVVGAIVGLIPGAGGQIAGLLAYDQSKKFSKNPENYGKGEADGVISSESANNAMVGSSLVPMLSLGIPGSPTAAVLLGGLLIQGLFPGPDLFTQHGQVVWTFLGALLAAQILLMVFGLYISSLSRYVIRIPKQYMAGAVAVLAIFGTFSVQHSYSDVLVMLVLGTGMYFAMRYGFGPGPVVLGIILGPIAEENLLQGLIIAPALDGPVPYFFTGTINIVLISLCLVSVGYSIYSELKIRSRRRAAQSAEASGK
ncbi:tripartite tricarboxylate transporter permease [Thioalkalivibrio thiocyanodenitrificans]|uniref:tripartite tricarboxylate transporter permease n=1 Tax=Thioalkalivibrio thiocyanodenitrificans TaxID=243063 RepID=UPI0003658AA6|nr:tripartite tricarboxylate transporter permease [Thioalkalivibrio thiocyanodenitrificans]